MLTYNVRGLPQRWDSYYVRPAIEADGKTAYEVNN